MSRIRRFLPFFYKLNTNVTLIYKNYKYIIIHIENIFVILMLSDSRRIVVIEQNAIICFRFAFSRCRILLVNGDRDCTVCWLLYEMTGLSSYVWGNGCNVVCKI